MKIATLITLTFLLAGFSATSQSIIITPNGSSVQGDSTQFLIGNDTILHPVYQVFGYNKNNDTLIWGTRNKSFQVDRILRSDTQRDIYELSLNKGSKPAQFDIVLPAGNVSFNTGGNLLLGGQAPGDTTTLLLDIQSRKPGPILTASIIGISAASRILHTQRDTLYNEVHGLYSYADSANFVNTSLFGEAGKSGSVANIGVMGRVFDSPKTTSKYIGISGIDAINTPNSYAGEFIGKVKVFGNLTVNGTIAKSAGKFKIDHPLDPFNKYLYHSFVESPDMMNIYNGNITTGADSLALVELPDYFESLNMDFRYQLTVIGQFAQAIVFEAITGNQFIIKTDKPNVQVSWQVTGIRKDAYANNNRVVPEQLKPANEQGTLIYYPPGGGGGGTASLPTTGKNKTLMTYPN